MLHKWGAPEGLPKIHRTLEGNGGVGNSLIFRYAFLNTDDVSSFLVPGATCNEEVDYCISNPCVNGNCSKIFNGYECICTEGFNGKLF